MARVLDELPPSRCGSTYPWDEWLDGRAWELLAHVDYPAVAKHHTFGVVVRKRAKQRGLKVKMRSIDEDGQQIGWAIQAVPTLTKAEVAHAQKVASRVHQHFDQVRRNRPI